MSNAFKPVPLCPIALPDSAAEEPITPAPMVDFDQLFAHRGGFETAYMKLCVFAVDVIERRSGPSGGGAVVRTLDAKVVVADAFARVLTENTQWDDGEAVYRLLRRHIDNKIHTIQKSPVVARQVSLDALRANLDDEKAPDFPDEGAANPADQAAADEEESFYKSVLEATKPKYPAGGNEWKFIDLLIEGWRDRQEVCELLQITPEQYDALLKRVSRAAKAKKLEMLGKRKS